MLRAALAAAAAASAAAQFASTAGFIAVRGPAVAAPYVATWLAVNGSFNLGAVSVDDFSGCTGAAECTPTATTFSADAPCTLTGHANSGRLSRSADGSFVQFMCYRAAPTNALTSTVDYDATIARLFWSAPATVDTSFGLAAATFNIHQALNGLHASNIPVSAASVTANDVFTTSDRFTGAQGLYSFDRAGNIVSRMRSNDGVKGVYHGDTLYFIWGGSSIKVLAPEQWNQTGALSGDWDFESVYFSVNDGAADLDVVDFSSFYYVAATGLWRVRRNAQGVFIKTLADGSKRNLTMMALSDDKQTVFVGTNVTLFAWSVAAGAYLNGGAPIATAPAGTTFRGVAAVPVNPATRPAATAAPTPVPVSAMPTDGFLVVRVGDGQRPVPDAVLATYTGPVNVDVYAGCSADCASATLDRTLAMPAYNNLPGAGNPLAFSLFTGNGQSSTTTYPRAIRWSYNQGRLVPSENRGIVTLAGFSAQDKYGLTASAGKREPSVLRINQDGSWNHSTLCTTYNPTTYKRIYCNGFDNDEPAYSAATTDGTEFWLTGSDSIAEVTNGPYGIAYNTLPPTTAAPANIVGLGDRNDVVRVQVHNRRTYWVQQWAQGQTTQTPRSTFFMFAGLLKGVIPKPAPLFSTTNGELITDFAVVNDTRVWIGTPAGIRRLDRQPNGNYTMTANISTSSVRGAALFVGISQDAATLYVSTVSDAASGVFSFNTATLTYNNGGAPILSAGAGFQFRGVAAAPIVATPSQTPSNTPSSSQTPSNTATSSGSPSQTPTNTASSSTTASVSATSTVTASASVTASTTPSVSPSASSTVVGSPPNTPSITASPSETASMTPTSSITASSSTTASGTPSPSATGSISGGASPSGSTTATPSASSAPVLVAYTFEDAALAFTTTPSGGANAASASLVPQGPMTIAAGGSSGQVGGKGLQMTGWAPQGTGNATAGMAICVSTAGFAPARLTLSLRSSNTACRDKVVQYRTSSSGAWTGVATVSASAGDAWDAINVALPADDASTWNNADFCVRIVGIFAPGTTGYVAARVASSAYATTGTMRWDTVTLVGSVLPTPSNSATGSNTPSSSSTASVTASSTSTSSGSITATQTGSASITPSSSPTASNTASSSPTASGTPPGTPSLTNSPTATNSATKSNSPTRTVTPTGTRSQLATASATWTAKPTAPFTSANQFVVAMIGAAGLTIPLTSHMLVPVQLQTYNDCGAGCSAATLDRTIDVPSANEFVLQRERFVTCNGGSVTAGGYLATFRGCKLNRANDGNMVLLAGYDAYATYVFSAGKREPAMVRLHASGNWDTQVPCKVARVPINALTNDHYYCNGFDDDEIPLSITTNNGAEYWLAGAEAGYHVPSTSNYGIRRTSLVNNTAPASMNLADRNDYETVKAYNNKFWFMSMFGGSDRAPSGTAMWFNPRSALYRLESLPTVGNVVRPAPFLVGVDATWFDFEPVTDDLVFIAGSNGLSVGEQVDGVWGWRMLSTQVRNIIGVAASNDKTTLYASVASFSHSGVFSWDIATASWNNGGAPILTPPAGFQFRGIAAAPAPGAAPTPTSSRTPAMTPTASPTNTVFGYDISASGTPAVSPTPTPTVPAFVRSPSATMTPLAPLPAAAFVLSLIGDGVTPIPALREVTVPVQLRVHADCQAGCSGGPALLRNVEVPFVNGNSASGQRAISVLASSIDVFSPNVPAVNPFGITKFRSTYRAAKLNRAADGSVVAMAGFDVWAGFDFLAGKREPAFATLAWTGELASQMYCKTVRTSNNTMNDPIYCNGFDGDELPLAYATVDGSYWFMSGGEIPTSTPYGIKGFSTLTSTTSLASIAGLSTRNDFDTLRIFGGQLYWFTATGGPVSANDATAPFAMVSALYRAPLADMAPGGAGAVVGAAPIVTGSGAAYWNDFDVESAGSIWVATAGGLLRFTVDVATGLFAQSFASATVLNIISVSLSGDRSALYAVSNDGATVHSFDVSSQAWNAEAEAILTAPAGYAYRGVAPAPIRPSASPSSTASSSGTPTSTPSASATASNTASSSATASLTPSASGTGTPSASGTGSGTSSATASATASMTDSMTPTSTSSSTSSISNSASATASASTTTSGTGSASGTGTPSASGTGTPSPSSSETPSASETTTASPSGTLTGTRTTTKTSTGTRTQSPTTTGTRTQTATATTSRTGTPSASGSRTGTPSASGTRTGTPSASGTTSASVSASPSGSTSMSASGSSSGSSSGTASATSTGSRAPTRSKTATKSKSRASVSKTRTRRAGSSATRTPKATKSRTATATKSRKKKKVLRALEETA